jgi:hypothetical protein
MQKAIPELTIYSSNKWHSVTTAGISFMDNTSLAIVSTSPIAKSPHTQLDIHIISATQTFQELAQHW